MKLEYNTIKSPAIENANQITSDNHINATHKIPIGALVELESGVRLFVIEHTYDCDGEPLYNLTHNITDYLAVKEKSQDLKTDFLTKQLNLYYKGRLHGMTSGAYLESDLKEI